MEFLGVVPKEKVTQGKRNVPSLSICLQVVNRCYLEDVSARDHTQKMGGKKMGRMSARENMTATVEGLQRNLGVCLYRHAHACAYVCVHVCV